MVFGSRHEQIQNSYKYCFNMKKELENWTSKIPKQRVYYEFIYDEFGS